MDEKKVEEQNTKVQPDERAEGFQAIAEGPQNETTQETQTSSQRETKLATATLSISERLNRPFEPLADNTIQAIIDTPSANEVDKDAARKEAEYRKENGGFDPSASHVDIREDLKDHYYSIAEGRFLIPTDEYVEYRDALKNGNKDAAHPYSRIRETIDEMNERAERLAHPRTPEEIIANFFDDRNNAEEYLKNYHSWVGADGGTLINKAKRYMEKAYRKVVDILSSTSNARAAYRRCFTDALASENPNLSMDSGLLTPKARELAINQEANNFNYSENSIAFRKLSATLFENQAAPGIENVSDEEKRASLIKAIGDSLGSGRFLGNLCKEDPDAAKSFVEGLNITESELDTIIADFIINSKRMNKKGAERAEIISAYNDVFGISERLTELLTTNDTIGIYSISLDGEGMRFAGTHYGENYSVPKEITARVKELIAQKAKQEAEALQSGESFQKYVESAKEIARESVEKDIIKYISDCGKYPSESFNLDPYLAMRSLDARRSLDLSSYPKSYGEYIRGELTPIIFDFDPTEMIKQEVMRRIAIGSISTYEWNGYGNQRTTKFMASFLNAENFPQIKEQLGLSFADDESYELAFQGFMDTLSGVNGEKSDAAAGYYRSIFADDPDRFMTAINAFRNNDCPVGLKRKITRFLDDNEEFQLYVQQKKIRDKLEEERTKTQKIILQESSYDEVKKLIDERIKQLQEEILKRSMDADTTFTPDDAPQRNYGNRKRNSDYKVSPIDFGTEKISTLTRWEGYLKNNIDEGTRHFVRKFDDGEKTFSIIGDPNTYHVITFQYSGKQCAIAESFSDDSAAMYVARADSNTSPEVLIERMFAGTKADARGDREIGVEALYHYGDDLDSLYQKAYAYLRTGRRPSNVAEAQEYGHRLFGDESELGQIREGELPPQYPFI